MGIDITNYHEKYEKAKELIELGRSIKDSCRMAGISVGKFYELEKNIFGAPSPKINKDEAQEMLESLRNEFEPVLNQFEQLKKDTDKVRSDQKNIETANQEIKKALNQETKLRQNNEIELNDKLKTDLSWLSQQTNETLKRLENKIDGINRDLKKLNEQYKNHVHGSFVNPLIGDKYFEPDAGMKPVILKNRRAKWRW